MANNTIQIKRTSVAGRAANTTTLTNPAELAINMADRIMYSTDGTTVFEIGANTTNSSVSNTLTLKAVSANGTIGTAGQVLSSNGSSTYWKNDATGGGGSATISEVTVDFGSTPLHDQKFNISFPGALTTQKILCSPSYANTTISDEDDFAFEPWNVAGRIVVDDNIVLYVGASSPFGKLHGQKKINLLIG